MPYRLNDILALSHVPRWVIVPTIKSQSVADHSFRVTFIALTIHVSSSSEESISADDLLQFLIHDIGESRTGDIPSSFKSILRDGKYDNGDDFEDRESRALGYEPGHEIDDYCTHLLKIADLVEAITFIRVYGVTAHANRVEDEMMNKLDDLLKNDPPKFEAAVRSVMNTITTAEGR